ncbi:hypothetical protein L6V77_23590 [Myxococcota bacterium]|nr:hypothetical protein [Myxococcota bacterium]
MSSPRHPAFSVHFTALIATALSLLVGGCGGLGQATFTPMEHVDPQSGVEVLYAMPEGPGWRRVGQIKVEDARSESTAESLLAASARRNGCDAVFIAGINEFHEVSALSSIGLLVSLGGSKDDRRRAEARRDADLEEPHYAARGVCLARVRVPRPAPVATLDAAPDASASPPEQTAAPVQMSAPVQTSAPAQAAGPSRAVSKETLSALVGEHVTLVFRNGRTLTGVLAGDDGESLFVRADGSLLRVPAAQLASAAK